MAIKYFCENPDCSGFRKTITETKVRYVMKEGKLVPSDILKCKECGELYSYTEDKNETIPSINIGEYAGMSNTQRSQILKKRAQKFNKKDNAQEKKEYYKDKAIKNLLGLK